MTEMRTTDHPSGERGAILSALSRVMDPDLGRDIVSLGFVKNLEIDGPSVRFDLELTTPACPMKDQLRQECESVLKSLPGIENVEVSITSRVRSAAPPPEKQTIPGVKNMIAVASGKGGVGKSTVSANLALALAASGARVGLMDADIYGPSMPMMFGVDEAPNPGPDDKITPLEKHGVHLISMGFFIPADQPVIWRGPMVHSAVHQFLTQVSWGEMDYLVVDLPPGTGDAQLTLCQEAPLSGAVIVTTPQDVSLTDARKGLNMFRSVKVPVLGIVENMSYFICGHCGERTDIFKHGGGERVARDLGVSFLGHVPLDPTVVTGGDDGLPVLIGEPDSQAAASFREIAGHVAARLSVESFAEKEAQPGMGA